MAVKSDMSSREVTFEIKEHIGVISENNKGWTKEVNLVSWNGGEAKYDIREWDPEHVKMSRGVTLNEEQVTALRDILNSLELAYCIL